jgi:hypothetical protein
MATHRPTTWETGPVEDTRPVIAPETVTIPAPRQPVFPEVIRDDDFDEMEA